ncbi:hypothetical protein JHK82_034093 [Glycine max]|nr:hypothetical protein JHK85_034803 [Glycine max]KAG4986472.1 hypothetical protein JHK86_034163 [Glycine max]KAG5119673.1 hypothetical protein JHK82_034093 [Glycine max]KAG5140662.1 hypothetical protein JHK84_034430 [Glycine max]
MGQHVDDPYFDFFPILINESNRREENTDEHGAASYLRTEPDGGSAREICKSAGATRSTRRDDNENPNAEEDLAERDYDSEDQTHYNHPNSQPHVETEVLSDHGVQMSQFLAVIKRSVNCPHSSITAIVALERALESGENKARSALEHKPPPSNNGLKFQSFLLN